MIWVEFRKITTAALMPIKAKIDSLEYIETFESSLFLIASEKCPQG